MEQGGTSQHGSGALPVAVRHDRTPDPLPRPAPSPSPGARPVRLVALVAIALVLAAVAVQRNHPVLVQGAPSAAPAPYAEPAQRLVPLPAAPVSSAYRAIQTGPDGRPVTWSPCRPLHYVIRAANMPAGGREAVVSAFARFAQATGLVVVDDGVTDEPIDRQRPAYQPERYGDRWAPVLVVWGKRTDLPEFMGDVAGLAGPVWAQVPDGPRTYVTGQVLLDAEKFHEIEVQWGSGEPSRSVVLHELGHLAGLDHAPGAGELMWSRGVSGPPWDYRAGDLAGLAALGSGPCNPAL